MPDGTLTPGEAGVWNAPAAGWRRGADQRRPPAEFRLTDEEYRHHAPEVIRNARSAGEIYEEDFETYTSPAKPPGGAVVPAAVGGGMESKILPSDAAVAGPPVPGT